jgi:hypothetical protein
MCRRRRSFERRSSAKCKQQRRTASGQHGASAQAITHRQVAAGAQRRDNALVALAFGPPTITIDEATV